MDKSFQKHILTISSLTLSLTLAASAYSFELLSEGAMGSVSAVSANSAEDIINVLGSTAAGLTVDDDYDELPFQAEKVEQIETVTPSAAVVTEGYEADEVSVELNFELTREVENWATDLDSQQGSKFEIGYVDELPDSTFEDSNDFIIVPNEFESVIYDNDLESDENTLYQIGRVDQTITVLESGVDSIHYIVERYVERAATIAYGQDDGSPSMGSGYITDLRSISNVNIARIRD